jgi:methanogenic corrinoid protein MtbC1
MSSFRTTEELENSWPACSPEGWHLAASGSSRIPGTPLNIGAVLARTIECDVIPRLMLANERTQGTAARKDAPTAEDVAEFVRLVLTHEPSVGAAFIETLRDRGNSLEAIFIQLFAPSARYLGELWKADIYSFTDVTIGLLALHTYVRQLSPDFGQRNEVSVNAPRALLTPAPADQHIFGLAILREFMQHGGWDVTTEHPKTAEQLVNIARNGPYRVIGLSVGCDLPLENLSTLIQTLRRAIPDPALHIMVGGRFFLENPDFVSRVGADSTAQDGRRAARLLSSLLDTNAMR